MRGLAYCRFDQQPGGMRTGKAPSIPLLPTLGSVRYDISNPALEQRDLRNFDIPLTATRCDSSARAGAGYGSVGISTTKLEGTVYIFVQLLSHWLSV